MNSAYLNKELIGFITGKGNVLVAPYVNISGSSSYKVTFHINPETGIIHVNGTTLSDGESINVQPNSNLEFYAETENGILSKATTKISENNVVIYIIDKKSESGDEPTYTISGSKEISVPVSYDTETEKHSVIIDKDNGEVTYKVNDEIVEEKTLLLVTFNVTPSDSTIEVNGSSIKFDELRVVENTKIDYVVSKEGYVSVSGSKTITTNETITVELTPEPSEPMVDLDEWEYTTDEEGNYILNQYKDTTVTNLVVAKE